jgi:hypothetical protein
MDLRLQRLRNSEIAARIVYYALNALIAHELQVNSLPHTTMRAVGPISY